MACYGCGQTFRDKGGTVVRSTYHSLCYDCMLEVLEVYDAPPEKRLRIYNHLIENGFYLPDWFVQQQRDEVEIKLLDPTDRMFSPRQK